MIVQPSNTQAGDIGFYANHGSPLDNAISLRTGSKVVHTAVFKAHGITIAATSGGITEQPSGGEYRIWRPNTPYAPPRLAAGLAFLEGEKGKPYGYADVINQLLILTGKDPVLLDKSSDCSDLAAKFLWIAGWPLPAVMINTLLVVPGALYTALTGLKE